MLSVNPIEQTQSFKGMNPSTKKIVSAPSDKKANALVNMQNISSIITWTVLGVAVLCSAVCSIVSAFSQNNKSDNVEVVETPKTADSENTLNLSI